MGHPQRQHFTGLAEQQGEGLQRGRQIREFQSEFLPTY
jgi:hypothetical protein